MTEPVTAAHLALADSLADAAGAVVRRYFRQKIAVDDKSDLTPVTIADREAEAAMRRLIEERFPTHGIIGEEHGRLRPDAEHAWVLDPIDGTKSFISGIPLFGTLIALTHRGAPVRTRPCPSLAAATLFCTAPEAMFRGDEAASFARLRNAVKLARSGADCYAYAQLASGFIDLVVEAGLKPYDYCALVPVIEGAGGVITDWQGRALDLRSEGRVVAAGDAKLAGAARAKLADGG